MSVYDEFFPVSERVIYERSPLMEVVCQLRFPTILRIEAQSPADFQELVRHQFPGFEHQVANPLSQLPPEFARLVGGALQMPQATSYVFSSADGKQKITLGPDSLAVSDYGYTRWEKYESATLLACDALARVYQPGPFSRIGLRYQNGVVPRSLGLDERPWGDLLSPQVVGELGQEGLASKLTESFRTVRAFDPATREGVLLQHGLGNVVASSERAYIFDIDSYTETQHAAPDAIASLRRFNARCRYAFRWCISDLLHNAMGPQPVV